MFKVLLSDFSQVILFPKNSTYFGSLNSLFDKKKDAAGFSFFDLYSLNNELLAFYKDLKKQHGLKLAIFTTGTVQNHPDLNPYLFPLFDQVFSAYEINRQKNDPESYSFLANELSVLPSEIIFIDDSMSNVRAAKEAGVEGIQFVSNEKIKSEVIKLL